MKIDVKHNDITPDVWQRCRDASGGQDDIHKGGEKYLPKLSGQDDKSYSSYKSRTPYFNATQRTIDGLVGMVYRKYPKTEVPAALEPIAEDVTLNGTSVDLLGKDILREVITVGRIGMLVEYPQVLAGPPTLAQASQLNYRPYVTEYKAEQIEHWREARVNNALQPVMVKLRETVTEWDGYESQEVAQIRYLLLEDGQYIQRVYRKDDKDNWLQFGPDIIPLMRGNPLPYIPFVCFGPNTLSLAVEKPPIIDLVNVNLSHYRTCADYENGAHFCGVPTPVLAGFQFEEKDSVKVGFGAITTTDPSAKWGYLEFTGQGLAALEKIKAEKEAQMAALGSRMLAAEKKQSEAEGTVKLRQAGEGAVLSSMARTVSEGLTRILEIMAEWQGIAGEVDHELNTDFADNGLTAQELTALVQSWQLGAMSYESLHWNLKKGEMLPDTSTAEDEQAAIGNAAPVLMHGGKGG